MPGELLEIVVESGGRSPVKSGPECRLADGKAAGRNHGLVVVGRATDHVGVRFDVAHDENG